MKIISSMSNFARRFPALVFFALVGVFLAHRITYGPKGGGSEPAILTVFAMLVSFALAVILQLALERRRKGRPAQYACAALCVILFFALAAWFRWMGCLNRDSFGIRLALVGGALAAIFAFLLLAKPEDGERNLPILAYPGVLAFGTALAIFASASLVFLAIEKLFMLRVPDIYEFLWFLSMLSIAPSAFVLFATGEAFAAPEKALRVVMDFILVPIFLANLAILLAYFAKCLFNWSLPNGQIVLLVSIASSIWLLFCLVLSNTETKFSIWFRHWTGIAVVPLLVMQSIAIAVRVRQYGLTPVRHLAVALTAFFAVAVALSLWRRGRHARWLYVVFAALALFSAGAPRLNCIDAGVASQLARAARGDEDAKRFAMGFHKAFGYYVGNFGGRRDGAPDKTRRSSSSWWLYGDRAFSIDASGYSEACAAEIAWRSSCVSRATEEEVAALADAATPLSIRETGATNTVATVETSALAALIKSGDDFDSFPQGMVSRSRKAPVLMLDGGDAFLILRANCNYYLLDENAPAEATNVVISLVDVKGIFFRHGGD